MKNVGTEIVNLKSENNQPGVGGEVECNGYDVIYLNDKYDVGVWETNVWVFRMDTYNKVLTYSLAYTYKDSGIHWYVGKRKTSKSVTNPSVVDMPPYSDDGNTATKEQISITNDIVSGFNIEECVFINEYIDWSKKWTLHMFVEIGEFYQKHP